MKIVGPKQAGNRRDGVDVERGAVIFDPWPFRETQVALSPDVGYLPGSVSDPVFEGPPDYCELVDDSDCVLGWSKSGFQCVMSLDTWRDAGGET